MKSKTPLLIALSLIFALSSTAYAHPPSEIKLSFDPATKILTAVITHRVANPLNHYIKKVDVAWNGKEIIEQKISRQDNFATQAVSYLVPDAQSGDTLSVEGYCSISGKLAKEIIVQ